MNEQDLRNVYARLMDSKHTLFETEVDLINDRMRLETAKRQARADGKIQGKNETERDDAARALLPEQFAQVEFMERQNMHARHLYELDALNVELHRALLRLEELTAKAAVLPTEIDGEAR